MQDVDVALGQDVRERARPRSRRRVAGNAQAGRKVDYEKGDDDPVEQGGREVAPQPLTRASLGRDSPCTLFLRSEEHTSELQSLMRISYAVFCLKKKNKKEEYTSHKTDRHIQTQSTHSSN